MFPTTETLPCKPLVDVDAELKKDGRRCDQCRAKAGMPHQITGEIVALRARYLDCNERNKAADNVAILCPRCATWRNPHLAV